MKTASRIFRALADPTQRQIAKAQVQILVEGVVEPATACDPLPADLAPTRRFTPEQICTGLPEPGPFGTRDLRCCAQ